jgi:pyruvate formate lyase activating enzyme
MDVSSLEEPPDEAADPLGLVLQVQRMSTEDGPGLRSTAFLKGCPLSCAWCHNPESVSRSVEIQWIGSRCIAGTAPDGCGACVAACPEGALARASSGALVIDRAACRGLCGYACSEACPGGAVERLGVEMRASALARELLKDRSYFDRSDRGGITLSGGEASAQEAFAREVLKIAKKAGVHTALDTCGFAAWESLAELYPYVDLVLWDLKELDPERHLGFTGAPVDPIIENLRRTATLMAAGSGPGAVWIRSPIVPGATDREEGVEAIGRLLASLDTLRLERWELCAFNNLCADKYRRLGIEWRYAGTSLMRSEDMDRLAAAAERGLGRSGIVSWTGSTRIE